MKIAVVMGSKSDLPKLESGIKFIKSYDNTDVIIAAAGKAAHLPGVIAAQTLIPVVGLPIKSSTMDGMDSLLSIVQMPSGIPVATVTIDSGMNAALMAIQIASVKYPVLREKLAAYRKEMADKVLADDASVEF